MKYAGLGFEILASMLFCVGIGYALDKYFETEKPWFVLTFSLLGCVMVIYIMIKSLNRK
jgi:F0F1-type ATP synthase assembly protein I